MLRLSDWYPTEYHLNGSFLPVPSQPRCQTRRHGKGCIVPSARRLSIWVSILYPQGIPFSALDLWAFLSHLSILPFTSISTLPSFGTSHSFTNFLNLIILILRFTNNYLPLAPAITRLRSSCLPILPLFNTRLSSLVAFDFNISQLIPLINPLIRRLSLSHLRRFLIDTVIRSTL